MEKTALSTDRHRRFRLLKTIIGLVFVVFLVLFLTKVIVFLRSFSKDTGLTPVTTARLLFDSGVPLAEHDGRTNILILGMGGDGHTGSDLTDTMIIFSLGHNAYPNALMSLPRDMWSVTLQDKINSAYHYGEEKKTGGGEVLARLIVNESTGIPIHYVIRLDFSGFKEIIDLIGGVDVDVTKAFTDTQYPILGKEADTCNGDPQFKCRYEEVHFDAGMQHMDGYRALAYVRSRHADGSDGTDFARSKRQQDVLIALKQKLSQPDFWLDVGRVRNVLTILQSTTKTDMNIGQMATIAKAVSRADQNGIKRISFEKELTEGVKWQFGGKYVLVPKTSLADVHGYIQSQLQ